ncbi:uncharacterized protein [Epargyreus clarus]|uniref:uncharacterized protein n=1 Tax=Epargyreus clarus TaxID=520877 RepID=UPI003C2F371B
MRCWLPTLALALCALQAVTLGQAVTEQTQHRDPAKVGCMFKSSAEETRVRCSLPAGRLTITSDNNFYFYIECERDANGRVGRFLCRELNTVTAKLRQKGFSLRKWPELTVRRCALHEPLSCIRTSDWDVNTLLLEDVPELRPRHLDGLELHSLIISHKAENGTVAPHAAFSVLPPLARLSTTRTRKERWSPALEHLSTLNLTGLSEVPAGAFSGLPNLEKLILGGHTIKHINEEAFKNLTNLFDLYLNTKAMKSLPPTLLRPTRRLQRLEISDPHLQCLSRKALRHLKQLEMVKISNENMSELGLEAGTFSEFSNLIELRIESCGARSVPADLVRGSRSLVVMSLKDNQLTELPGELLAEQADLQILSLAQNHLCTLPHNLFAVVSDLDELDLSENAIEYLPNNIFKSMESLHKLNLTRNNLKQLEPELFVTVWSLEQLLLAHNALVRAELATYEHLLELKTLDLSHNAITQLLDSDLTFKWNGIVDLSYNNISRFSLAEDDQANSKKSSYRLINNTFICDCNLYDFVIALKEPNVAKRFYLDDAHCGSPASLSGKRLSTVSADVLTCALDTPPCPAHCACALRPAAARLELDCPAAPSELPPLAPLNATAVHLRLHTVPDDLAALPPEVRFVDLSGLGLTVAPRALGRLDNLTVDLSNNNLTIAPTSLLKAKAKVHLVGNRFECDCNHHDSIATLELYSIQLGDHAELQCQNGDRVMRTPAERLCTMRNAIVLGSSMVALGLILAALGMLVFRYTTEIRLVLRRYEALDFLFQQHPDPEGLEEKYDAFVSFSHHDDDFVQDELVPQLECGRQPLRLCLHYRDWEIGGLIPEQITRSVSESRRTIVVMSRKFLESNWGRIEFRAAHALDRVIVLLRGDVLCAAKEDPELRAYLITKTYVHADDPLVWDRVRDAVLRSRRCRAPTALPQPALSSFALTALPRPALLALTFPPEPRNHQ